MLTLRRARFSDMEMYFRWANDPEARANSWNSEPIPWETHQTWFDGQLSDDAKSHYVAELDGVPVGQVRFSLAGEEALIGFSLDPVFRGKGLGGCMLRAALARYAEECVEASRFKAQVKRENSASNRIFAGLGFSAEEDAETGGIAYRLEVSRMRREALGRGPT